MQVWLQFSLKLRKALLVTGLHGLWGATASSSLSDTTANASAVSEEGGVATVGGCSEPPRDVSNQNFPLPFDSSELL